MVGSLIMIGAKSTSDRKIEQNELNDMENLLTNYDGGNVVENITRFLSTEFPQKTKYLPNTPYCVVRKHSRNRSLSFYKLDNTQPKKCNFFGEAIYGSPCSPQNVKFS